MNNKNIKISKFLSFVLRHNPDSIGLQLDNEGWVAITELISCAAKNGQKLTETIITEVVATNDKKRFSLSLDGQRIRANQGHSIPIDLGLPEREPPALLYHGTATRFIESILRSGLMPGSRQHVHLSSDQGTALKVGQRHGQPVILQVNSGQMFMNGCKFYCSENGVWLTDHVGREYLTIIAES
jgi:putative RNA 2'-phosphotransferase